jgi:predicted O-methyltransferase YrrM
MHNIDKLIGMRASDFDHGLAESESTAVENIEKLRLKLESSQVEVEVTDYGAGSIASRAIGQPIPHGRLIKRKIGEICKSASSKKTKAMILFKLIRDLKPMKCLELGTCVGISACYQAFALKLNGQGKLITLEGSEKLASIASQNVQLLGLENVEIHAGRFLDVLPGVLHQNPAIDFVFIDGHHEEIATVNYWKMVVPYLAQNAIVILDDITWSDGMARAWNTVKNNSYVQFSTSSNALGICFVKRQN